jgi:hypothetical protein
MPTTIWGLCDVRDGSAQSADKGEKRLLTLKDVGKKIESA